MSKMAKTDSDWERKLLEVEELLIKFNIVISVKDISIDGMDFNLVGPEIGSGYNDHTEDLPRWSDDIRLYLKESEDD